MSHTPGPWTWFERQQMRFLVGANGQGFAHTVGLGEPQDVANANLIAAAPDLLVACKELRESLAGAMRVIDRAIPEKADIIDDFVDEMKACGIQDGVGVRAQSAIAKAEDGQ